MYTQGGPYKENFPTIYRVGSKYNRNSLLFVWDVGIISDHNSYSGLLPRAGIEYGFLEQYFFRGGYGNGRMAFGIGYEYALFKSRDSNIDYAFSLDWASQSAHTISYAFNF